MIKTLEQTGRQADPVTVRVLADLCRARPAVFAQVVRHSDWLTAKGCDGQDAIRVALDAAGVRGGPLQQR